ncbi:MAG TPA: DUF1844 domain-containing protein [Candidatus Poseidoniales archaeon]|nr:MAG: hypothetical protein CXX80_12335 [Euryarchaeota archaeon]HIA39929.1 DUF1844 domain-containing protein [Candidatus Poseidoniales archaeon]PXY75398.1 MAG: hypothetical protein CXX80_04920 [Euryarchaeota archaeon]PXY77310.1 MAG: hypothetical protein CXX80_01015 [Euryarchaeota archaeon]HIA89978.1 DUF1844 domain-containing protein [Candidatus Poseidoniales archaeon]
MLVALIMSEDIFNDERSAQFFTVVHMFQRTAMVHMGMMPDHEGNRQWNMVEAKSGIDMIQMLKEKTEGNLQEQETKLLSAIIAELQMQFVNAPQAKKDMEAKIDEAEKTQQAFTSPRDGPAEEIVNDGEEE